MACTGNLSIGPEAAASFLLFLPFVFSSVKTAPEMRPAVTPMQVEIISFLRAALAVPVPKISLYSLENAPKEEQCSLHSIALLDSLTLKQNRFFSGFPHLKAQQIFCY